MSELTIVDRDRVRTITLDRPASRNWLTHELASQIAQFLQKRRPRFTGQ